MHRLSVLLLAAACLTASAYQIHVEYESKDYGTNFFTTVPPGEDFYYVNQISSGQDGVRNSGSTGSPPSSTTRTSRS